MAGPWEKFSADAAGPWERFSQQQAKPTNPVDLGPGGFRSALEGVIQEESSPAGARLVAGAGTALDNAAMRLKQVVSGLTPQDEARVQANRELTSTPLGMTGAVAGSIGMVGGPVAAATRALAPVLTGTGAAATVGGATAAATNPVLSGESELANIGLGAAGAAGGDLAARGVARAVQPIMQSEPVKKLLSEGVVPTPGQAAGGFASRVEQRIESIPLIGDLIKRSKTRAIEELNKAAINRTLPNGERITVVGRAAMERADEIFDDAYRGALSGKTVKDVSGTLGRALDAVKKSDDLLLTEDGEKALTRLVDSLKTRTGVKDVDGEMAKKIDSLLGSKAAEYSRSGTVSDRDVGFALKQIQAALRKDLEAVAPQLKAINSKYADFLRVQKASGYIGAGEGVFSPSQFQRAVRAMDPSGNKRAFSQGTARMQDLSGPAKSVMGDTVPNSGTADRALMAYLLGGSAAGVNDYLGGPEFLTALGLSPLLYSRPGARYMVGDLPGQSALSGGLRSLAPYAAQAGRVLTPP